ncbi:MAG: AGE family epimerase/isomerase [Lachnospiraceae bacterium]|nr:AGE family epimerase/isomerase [Lachnospiraceae bacterium]
MNKYIIDTKENRGFQRSLREDLIWFGERFPSPGGGSYYLGDDGTPCKDRPRETWITSRMAHVYSMGALLGYEGSLQKAEAAVKGLRGELHDDKNGGWYAGICADGKYLPDKQCYAHAFVILAATSAMLAGISGARELYEDAVSVYDRYFWNEAEGLAADTWNTDFTELSGYRGLNANMHTVEAFLAASDVSHDETYRIRAGRIIERVIGWAEENSWRIPEHFTDSWSACLDLNKDRPDDPFKPFGATPGHGIEWARLIVQWTLSTFASGSKEAEKYISAAKELYARAVKDAWSCDGAPGLCYTTDWTGKSVVHDRMHWTLAEAINTSAVLYRITKDAKYASDYAMFMEYLDGYVVDHDNGSWFHQLDSKNHVTSTVWPGKPDLYHAVQATLIPYVKDPGISVAVAVKSGRMCDEL